MQSVSKLSLMARHRRSLCLVIGARSRRIPNQAFAVYQHCCRKTRSQKRDKSINNKEFECWSRTSCYISFVHFLVRFTLCTVKAVVRLGTTPLYTAFRDSSSCNRCGTAYSKGELRHPYLVRDQKNPLPGEHVSHVAAKCKPQLRLPRMAPWLHEWSHGDHFHKLNIAATRSIAT